MPDSVEECAVEGAVPSTAALSSWVLAMLRFSKNATAPDEANTCDDRDAVLSISSSSDSEYDPVRYPAAPQNSQNGSIASSHDGFQDFEVCEVENSKFRSQIETYSNELLRILDECATPMTSSEKRQLLDESRKIALLLGDDIEKTKLTLQVSSGAKTFYSSFPQSS